MATILVRALDPDAPVVTPPDGIVSNFVNPTNGNSIMIGVSSAVLALVLSALVVHFSGRISRKLHLEDYLVIPAIGSFITFNVFVYRITATTGYFVHGWDLQVKDSAWHFFNIFISTSTYDVTMIFVKGAILVQWARVFTPGIRNTFFWLCYTVATLNAIFYLVVLLTDLLYCTPVQYHWDMSIPGGHCADDNLLSPFSAAINVALDITILLLPQRVIWKLNIPLKKKVGISSVFLMGLLCIISAIIRLKFSIVLLSPDNDYAYTSGFEILLGNLEMTFAFLTFAFPGLPRPFATLMQYAKSSSERLVNSSWSDRTWLSRTFATRKRSYGSNIRHADVDEGDLILAPKVSSSKSNIAEQRQPPIPMHGLPQEASDHKIVRTTNFNMSESFKPPDETPTSGILPQHHPWEPLPSHEMKV
ncbi:hypothetical protein F4860DRAFT_522964 [Xylaria cubensis]|nr:hypothetical protein F4860DRAFT_522964 [Xylaria cubensis]